MTELDPGDGLPVAVVRNWSEEKYRHVEYYARLFAQAMKGKWDRLIYLDLFAGGGRVKIEDSQKIIDSAALRALGIEPAFDLFAYAELDAGLLTALEERVARRSPPATCLFKQGDVNLIWPTLRDEIRASAAGGTHLTFCTVDPWRCADLAFATIEGLAEIYVDFLILIPSFMDAHRNQRTYTAPENTALAQFLGTDAWREAWDATDQSARFGSFVANQLGLQMRSLGYRYDDLDDMKLIRSSDRNLRLYHLAFFSRHRLGEKLWRETLKYTNSQMNLFEKDV